MTISTEEESTELIGDIQNLQNIELDLYDTLEKGIANNTLTAADKTALIDQINKVTDMRVKLFSNLNSLNQHYQGSVASGGSVIQNQINALSIVETELLQSSEALKVLNNDKNNMQRMVEINTYYGEKYSDHKSIMKTIVYFCIPIILVTVLANMGFLPRSIYAFLLIILSVAAIVVIGVKLIKSLSHDNMNYQEYAWGTQPPTKPEIDTSDATGKNPWFSVGASCVAQECCEDGFTYVPSPINKCVANANLPTGVAPYNPNQAASTTAAVAAAGAASSLTSAASSLTSAASGAASSLTSAASGIASTATQSVASVYSSLSNL
jgi:hypothetical protein